MEKSHLIRMSKAGGKAAKMVEDALMAYESVHFYNTGWAKMQAKWPEGKRKHWQKIRMADWEGWLINAMDKFERLSSELDRMCDEAGVGITDGRFTGSPEIRASELHVLHEWLLLKEELKNKN